MDEVTRERLELAQREAQKLIVDYRGEIELYHEWIEERKEGISTLTTYVNDLEEILNAG